MSSTRVNPSDEQWKAARLLVAAFNDTDCRCDGIVLTEGAKENLKIKVAYALAHREQEVREEEQERAAKIAETDSFAPVDYGGLCLECGEWTPPRHPERGEHKESCSWSWVHGREFKANTRIAAAIRRDDTPQEGESHAS